MPSICRSILVVLLATMALLARAASARTDAGPASMIGPDSLSAGLAGLKSRQGEALIDDQFRYEYIRTAEDRKNERERDRDHHHVGVIPEPSSAWMVSAGALLLLVMFLRKARARRLKNQCP
jgi:hypothetical protein